jgi:hypothetical protein
MTAPFGYFLSRHYERVSSCLADFQFFPSVAQSQARGPFSRLCLAITLSGIGNKTIDFFFYAALSHRGAIVKPNPHARFKACKNCGFILQLIQSVVTRVSLLNLWLWLQVFIPSGAEVGLQAVSYSSLHNISGFSAILSPVS